MLWYLFVLAALVGGDQLLKHWVTTHLALGESAPFLPGIVRFTRLHNYGAAWSSFSGKTAALLLITTVLMVTVIVLLVKKIVRHPLGVAAGLLILGGGIGNYIDRIFRSGLVVDMFDLEFMRYPVFNLADCFVVVGTILGAIYYLWIYEKTDQRKKNATDAASDK